MDDAWWNIGIEELFRRVTAGLIDVQSWSWFGHTPLIYAVDKEQVQLAEALLERGADVNAVDDDGSTPLLHAVITRKSNELVPLLIKYGADVFAKDSRGFCALHCLVNAPITHMAELTRTFIEMGVSLRERNLYGYEPAHSAVDLGCKNLIRHFLNHGANVNERARNSVFPLYIAAERTFDNSEMLKILLERGADVRMQTAEGRTALHHACENLNRENIEILLSVGADVLAEDRNGNTPFALIRRSMMTDPSVRPMIRVLALKRACLPPSIELKDERIIGEYPKLWDYYRECHAHISRMKFTRFAKSCTFFELLAKSRSQIAALMRNPDFEANFGLYDLDGFSMYAEDVRRAFERAQVQHRFMLEREDAINEAFYHILPDVVVRRIVYYLCHFFEKTVVFSKY